MDIITDADLESTKVETQEKEIVSEEPKEPTEETKEPETVEVQPYTDEEFESLHTNELDESRLTSVQKKYIQKMKDLERGYNKKYEALAQERKQLETTTQTHEKQPTTVYEAFDKDPKGVMSNLRTLISQKKKEDPFSDEVIRLESMRDELLERQADKLREEIVNQDRTRQVENVAMSVHSEVRKHIPDFDEKAEVLTGFAINELGLDRQEILYLTDPRVMGPMAGKITLAVNRLYDMAHAGKSLKSKEVKKAPKVEKAGSGSDQPKQKTHSADDYFAQLAKSRA